MTLFRWCLSLLVSTAYIFQYGMEWLHNRRGHYGLTQTAQQAVRLSDGNKHQHGKRLLTALTLQT